MSVSVSVSLCGEGGCVCISVSKGVWGGGVCLY